MAKSVDQNTKPDGVVMPPSDSNDLGAWRDPFFIYAALSLTVLMGAVAVNASREGIGFEHQNWAFAITGLAVLIYAPICILHARRTIPCGRIVLFVLIVFYTTWSLLWSPVSIKPERSILYAALHTTFFIGSFGLPLVILRPSQDGSECKWCRLIGAVVWILFLYVIANTVWFYAYMDHGIYERLKGFQPHANNFAYIVFVSVSSIHLSHVICRKPKRAMLVIGIALAVLTQSRTLLMALIAYYLVFMCLSREQSRNAIATILVIGVLASVAGARQIDSYQYHVAGAAKSELSDYGYSFRLFMWSEAIEYWWDTGRVLIGTGHESDYEVTRVTEYGLFLKERYGRDARSGVSLHSGIIKIGVTQGAVGLLLFLAMQVVLFSIVWRGGKGVQPVGTALIVAGLCMAIPNVALWSAPGTVACVAYLILVMGVVMIAERQRLESRSATSAVGLRDKEVAPLSVFGTRG